MQGHLGCLRIPFSRGVCGAAARLRSTQMVPDVSAFPGKVKGPLCSGEQGSFMLAGCASRQLIYAGCEPFVNYMRS